MQSDVIAVFFMKRPKSTDQCLRYTPLSNERANHLCDTQQDLHNRQEYDNSGKSNLC